MDMKQVVHVVSCVRASCPLDELSMELSIGQVVHEAGCPRGELSMGRVFRALRDSSSSSVSVQELNISFFNGS
jgi:hypothetical protein